MVEIDEYASQPAASDNPKWSPSYLTMEKMSYVHPI
jgi:hypothetical protein